MLLLLLLFLSVKFLFVDMSQLSSILCTLFLSCVFLVWSLLFSSLRFCLVVVALSALFRFPSPIVRNFSYVRVF